jgi:hypothetical protein
MLNAGKLFRSQYFTLSELTFLDKATKGPFLLSSERIKDLQFTVSDRHVAVNARIQGNTQTYTEECGAG